jgi:type VI secretion system protein ImpJ
MVFLLALRSLNRYIPHLFHMADFHIHPWLAYDHIIQLIGELSSFSERITVMGDVEGESSEYLKYDHLARWQCFSRAQGVITALLDEITAGPDYVFALLSDGTYYSTELPPAVFEGRNRFYLVVQTSADPKDVLNTIATGAKLSSRESLPILIVRALPGLGITNLDRPPQELPRRANALYFQVDHHSDQWQNIVKGHNMALFWDAAPDDLKVELMVVGKG